MKKKTLLQLVLIMACLLFLLTGAAAETRQGVIALEGMEEPIVETLFESPLGFSFWYVKDSYEAYTGKYGEEDGVFVTALYTDDTMVLSLCSEQDAEEYGVELGVNILEQSAASRVQMDVYRDLENGRFCFLTLIAEKGRYLTAVGDYSMEAAEGIGKYFQRVLDSVAFGASADSELLRLLPGKWTEEYEGVGTVLTLEENGEMTLACHNADGSLAYSGAGEWAFEALPDYVGRLTLRFISADSSEKAESGSVECVYTAYTEEWLEDDTEITCLVLEPVSSSGVSPFEEIYGENGAALYRKQGPNMRVVKCKEFVSLREDRATSSKRIAKVPLGALVLAFPEEGKKNGFIRCVYQGEEGYILAEYLQPVEQ